MAPRELVRLHPETPIALRPSAALSAPPNQSLATSTVDFRLTEDRQQRVAPAVASTTICAWAPTTAACVVPHRLRTLTVSVPFHSGRSAVPLAGIPKCGIYNRIDGDP